MKRPVASKAMVSVALAGFSALGQAALTVLPDDRFVYDDVLDVTWLRDANYAQASGYDADGLMTWSQANAWADGLTFALSGSGGTETFSDWRLPTVTPVNGSNFNYSYHFNGSTDYGHNIAAPGSVYAGSTASELAYMYYQNLGNLAAYTPSGAPVALGDFGLNNTGPFENLQSGGYWSGAAATPDNAWMFHTNSGLQIARNQSLSPGFFAWAVHPGMVMAPIPEPAEWTMMLAGLGLVAGVARARLRVGAKSVRAIAAGASA